MKTEILSLVLLLSCTTASAAAVLPNSSGDLRALEENRAQQEKTAVLTKEEANQEVSGSRKFYLEKFVFTSADELPQDELAALLVQFAQAVVGGGAGLFEDPESPQQVPGHLFLADGEVLQAALGLGTPELVSRDGNFPHGVVFHSCVQREFLL